MDVLLLVGKDCGCCCTDRYEWILIDSAIDS